MMCNKGKKSKISDPLPFEARAFREKMHQSLNENPASPSAAVFHQLQKRVKEKVRLQKSNSLGRAVLGVLRFRLPFYQTIIISMVGMVLVSYASLSTLQRTPQKGNWPSSFEKDSLTLVADSLRHIPGQSIGEDSLLTRFFQPVM